jgi:hypothetical protein
VKGAGRAAARADQDNGLIFLGRRYTPPADLEAVCQRFQVRWLTLVTRHAQHHAEQPAMAAHGQGQTTRQWVMMPTARLMNLAIFMDAHAVC